MRLVFLAGNNCNYSLRVLESYEFCLKIGVLIVDWFVFWQTLVNFQHSVNHLMTGFGSIYLIYFVIAFAGLVVSFRCKLNCTHLCLP